MVKRILICASILLTLISISFAAQPVFYTYNTSNDSQVETQEIITEEAKSDVQITKEQQKTTKTEETKTETPQSEESVETKTPIPDTTPPVATKPVETKPNIEQSKPSQTVQKLVPTGNYFSVDRSCYTEDEIELLDIILAKIKTCNTHDLKEEYIDMTKDYDYYQYYKIASYFYVYYGQKRAVDETFDLINYTDGDGVKSKQIRLRYDDIRKFEKELNANKTKIDAVLSTFTTGSEEHILKQISEYLKNNIVYTNNNFDLSNALNGKSVCNGYALAFNIMANRAGITSDMCIGTVKGIYHAWNRVTLSDGTYRFYDITFYDTGGGSKYINSKTNFHGSYLINDYTDCWFN